MIPKHHRPQLRVTMAVMCTMCSFTDSGSRKIVRRCVVIAEEPCDKSTQPNTQTQTHTHTHKYILRLPLTRTHETKRTINRCMLESTYAKYQSGRSRASASKIKGPHNHWCHPVSDICLSITSSLAGDRENMHIQSRPSVF